MKTHCESFKTRQQAGLAFWRAHSWTVSFAATAAVLLVILALSIHRLLRGSRKK